ncbi:MAG: iron-containing alcohol dehydrogenase [Euryarchaeota archaeon]|nr:iron-containing alcohol dehydrogenase [Euryarchaeota archaeon]
MNFRTPKDVYFGWNSVKNLANLNNVAIITGAHVWKEVSDFVPVDGAVYEMNRTTPTGEPIMEDIDRIAEFLAEEKPEWIIAVGGGSVIDSAKLAWVFYEDPSTTWEKILQLSIPALRRRAKFAAVETSSGTGTGISAAAVVIDKDGLKHGIVSPELVPDIAVYDPDFVMSMPDRVVINSGMDALSHAIEAYVSKIDNLPADTLALKAIELIFENIKHSREREPDARANMHYANMMAAMGFANSRLGLCHAASHKIGGRYGIEHGKLNAILLPHFIRATRSYTRRYEIIERAIHIEDIADAIEELNRDFGIPAHLPQIQKDIDKIADEIMRDALMRYNPGKMSREEIIAFLRSVAGV